MIKDTRKFLVMIALGLGTIMVALLSKDMALYTLGCVLLLTCLIYVAMDRLGVIKRMYLVYSKRDNKYEKKIKKRKKDKKGSNKNEYMFCD